MQTFITYFDFGKCASILDNKRLGKQRVEAIQILDILLNGKKGWANHPAVKMWRGYESSLIAYIRCMMDEWSMIRGFKNEKSWERFSSLTENFKFHSYEDPPWITEEFIRAHRSNLIRKNKEFYAKEFPDVPNDLPYIWPIK